MHIRSEHPLIELIRSSRMQRAHLNGLGFVFALAMLSGCTHTLPSPQVAVAPVQAPVPVAPTPLPALPTDWVSAPQHDVAFRGTHRIGYHRPAHSYYRRDAYSELLQCGSDVHPCSMVRAVIPIQ